MQSSPELRGCRSRAAGVWSRRRCTCGTWQAKLCADDEAVSILFASTRLAASPSLQQRDATQFNFPACLVSSACQSCATWCLRALYRRGADGLNSSSRRDHRRATEAGLLSHTATAGDGSQGASPRREAGRSGCMPFVELRGGCPATSVGARYHVKSTQIQSTPHPPHIKRGVLP